jgi:hypothetical protein
MKEMTRWNDLENKGMYNNIYPTRYVQLNNKTINPQSKQIAQSQ